jgi:rSAM/selenodomain-associated transferase 2
MRVSVVIPARNEVKTLPLLLHDLAATRKAGHEIVVVDGGSDDDTVEIATPYADKVLRCAPGRAQQLNTGAKAATGDVLWFLHADSRVFSGTLEALLGSLGNKHCWGRFDVRLSGHQWPFRIIERLMNLRSCLTGLATGDQGIFVTRQVFESVGGFEPIPLMEDIRLSRALRNIHRPRCVREPKLVTSSRRWEHNGIWKTVLLMWRLRLAHALGADPDRLAQQYR